MCAVCICTCAQSPCCIQQAEEDPLRRGAFPVCPEVADSNAATTDLCFRAMTWEAKGLHGSWLTGRVPWTSRDRPQVVGREDGLQSVVISCLRFAYTAPVSHMTESSLSFAPLRRASSCIAWGRVGPLCLACPPLSLCPLPLDPPTIPERPPPSAPEQSRAEQNIRSLSGHLHSSTASSFLLPPSRIRLRAMASQGGAMPSTSQQQPCVSCLKQPSPRPTDA